MATATLMGKWKLEIKAQGKFRDTPEVKGPSVQIFRVNYLSTGIDFGEKLRGLLGRDRVRKGRGRVRGSMADSDDLESRGGGDYSESGD